MYLLLWLGKVQRMKLSLTPVHCCVTPSSGREMSCIITFWDMNHPCSEGPDLFDSIKAARGRSANVYCLPPRGWYNYQATLRRWRCSLHLALLSSSSRLWTFPLQPPPYLQPPPGPRRTTTALHRFVNLCRIPSSFPCPRTLKGGNEKIRKKICCCVKIIL